MKKWWQSYKSKSIHNKQKPSIAKDPVTLLDERLQFFTPKFNSAFSTPEFVLYIFAWSLFLTNIKVPYLYTWSGFVTELIVTFVINLLTIFPIIIFLNLRRSAFRGMPILRVSIYILIVGILSSLLSVFIAYPILKIMGVINIETNGIISDALFNAINVAGFIVVVLLYYVRNYKDLIALRTSFERRMDEQNENIKVRIAPHFFFNTINTLVSLVETEPEKASKLLQHVSHLFRASFNEPKECSLEDEIQLCEHYIEAEKYRLNDKLEVTWILPDEDMIYDMTITALTLQSVLEQTVLHIVERTLETVHITITVTWENHVVKIAIKSTLPTSMLMVSYDIEKRINFHIQEKRLRIHFGDTAKIETAISRDAYTNTITYPLHDAIV